MTERDSSKLSLSVKAVYGIGQFVDSISATTINTFLLFYLNEVCGLSGILAGASLGIALVVDAFVDPLMGSLSDNTQSRFGRRHPYMIGSLILIVLGLGLLFSIPRGLSTWPLFGYATLIALTLRVGLSGYIVPYTALGAELSDDYIDRSAVVAWRTFFSVFATLVPLVLGYVVFLAGAKIYDRAAYIPFAWSCAVIMTVFAAAAAFGTLGSLNRLHRAAAPTGDHPIARLFREIVEVFRNASFRLLFSSVLVFFVAQGTASALNLHGSKFFWHLGTPQILGLAVTLLFGVLVGLPAVWLTGNHVEKRSMVIWSLVYVVITQAGLPIAHIIGIIPNNPTIIVAALATNNFLVGIAITFLTVGFQSMMADAADEHEMLFGARREGIYFAGLSFSTKAASGLGGLISGAVLSLIHFPADLAAKGGDAAHIAPATVNALGLAYGIVPGVLTFACIVFTMFYRIDRAAHARIQETLAARRTGGQP
ncbi:MAG TPA: MFS transporter [Rhizomicrobium sp.]|jgi:GPH family glycoside/pentoside/hexuronide:cation symporter|nr:MFS transporter [Rhizomicrobium sp.]